VLLSKFEGFTPNVRLDEGVHEEENVIGGFKAILTD
jgi:hypothetical protein